jgi:hypothetical protein
MTDDSSGMVGQVDGRCGGRPCVWTDVTRSARHPVGPNRPDNANTRVR